jgi:hypothetical protein
MELKSNKRSDIASQEAFHFHMLEIVWHTCRLIILPSAIRSGRIVFHPIYGGTWHVQIRPHGGPPIVPIWSKDISSTCERVLVLLLEADRQLLATSPDVIFVMLTYAAVMVVGCKFIVWNRTGYDFRGSGIPLLKRTVQVLSEISFSADHAASRCAHLVTAIIKSWETRQAFDSEAAFNQSRLQHQIASTYPPGMDPNRIPQDYMPQAYHYHDPTAAHSFSSMHTPNLPGDGTGFDPQFHQQASQGGDGGMDFWSLLFGGANGLSGDLAGGFPNSAQSSAGSQNPSPYTPSSSTGSWSGGPLE